MKLEKFKKNKKHKNILLTFGIFVLVFGGGFLLYRSYANYEENKSYNVLKGQVGDFTKSDVQFAFLVDGTASKTMPQKDSGYTFTGVSCTNNATAFWDAVNWRIQVENITQTKTTCTLSFAKKTFNYGDGSLNTVSKSCTLDGYICTNLSETVGGYVDKLSIFNTATGVDSKVETTDENYKNIYTGNIHGLGQKFRFMSDFIANTSQKNVEIYSVTVPKYVSRENNNLSIIQGENEFACIGSSTSSSFKDTVKVIGDNNSILNIEFNYSNQSYHKTSNLQISLDGSYYTLKSAVEAGKIKPLVIIINHVGSRDSLTYYLGDNPVNLYDGGELIGRYGIFNYYFMLEENVLLQGVKFTTDRNISSVNGDFVIRKYDNLIMHLSE